MDKYKDMGTVVMGKIESGTISEGDNLVVMPNKVSVFWMIYFDGKHLLNVLQELGYLIFIRLLFY
jgi:translation elongation factor EF-1alpha